MEQREDSADWKTLVEFLSSLIQDPTTSFSKELLFQQLATVTADLSMKHRLHVWVVDEMKRCCFGRLASEFWRLLDVKECPIVECMSSAIRFLHYELFSKKDLFDVIGRYIPSYCRDLWEEVLFAMQAVAFVDTSHCIDDMVQSFLKQWFRTFCSCNTICDTGVADDSSQSEADGVDDVEQEQAWLETCQHCSELLHDLQLTQLLVRSLNQVISAEVRLIKQCSRL